MDKVLVVKAIEPNYNTVSGGPPIMMVGGGRRRRGGDEPVGRTKRERLGGALGGTVGVLGALGGQHRSLGSLAQAMISGGAQGKALGGALGRKFVGRTGQRRADIREGRRQQSAQSDAEMAEDVRNRGRGMGSRLNPYATYAGVRRRFNPDFQSGSERLENMGFNPFAAVRRRNTAVEEAEQQGLDSTNLNNRSRIQAQQQVGVYGAGRIADAREQAQRAANAEETARAKRSGAEQGSRDRADAESMRGMRDTYGNIFRPEDENTFNQMANQSARPIRYEVQDAEFEEDPAGHSGTVQPTNAADLPVPPQLMLPPPIQPTAGGKDTEINDIERAGNAQGLELGVDAMREPTVQSGKVAVTDGNEDEKEESLGRIQQREAGQAQVPGKRPPGESVQVRPTEQGSIYDFPGFGQGGN